MSSVGFSAQQIAWFESFLSNRRFQVNIKNRFSNVAYINCSVLQGSIVGPLLFLTYVNDMYQPVYCDLFLTKRLLYSVPAQRYQRHWSNTQNFYSKVCDWFVNNKLSIHFGEDKTKSILFHTKRKLTIERSLDIRHAKIHLRQ